MTTRNPHAGTPITDDDDTIAAALEDVSIPTLMLSMVHMTGDPSIIRGELRPQGLFLNEVQGYMSEADKAEVRRRALDVIRDYRDGGSEPRARAVRRAHPRDDELARLPGRARRVRPDDARGDGARRRRRARGGPERRPTTHAPRSPSSSSVADSPGCSPASGCRKPGIPFTIVEKNAGVGGTWYENTYPGAASTSATTSTATRSNRATTGASTSRSSPSCSATSPT